MLTNTSNNTKNPTVVIGIDHGYGNIKTANTCFRAGVTAYDKEPFFIIGSLQYNGKWYGISEEHKEFIPDKMTDQDYYILTLAAIARELELEHMTSANIHLAVGLPLTWVSEQKDRFRKYLIQRKEGVGGGCLIRHFGEYDPNRVTINEDICATAKGFEFLANLKLKKANAA